MVAVDQLYMLVMRGTHRVHFPAHDLPTLRSVGTWTMRRTMGPGPHCHLQWQKGECFPQTKNTIAAETKAIMEIMKMSIMAEMMVAMVKRIRVSWPSRHRLIIRGLCHLVHRKAKASCPLPHKMDQVS
jgi:hypothetical protein